MAAGRMLRDAAVRLSRASIPHAHREATLLLGAAAGVPRTRLLMMDDDAAAAVTPTTRDAFERLVARRERHEPLAYLVGQREFWSLPFDVGPGVLIPRPATETVVETLLELRPDRAAVCDVCDLGVGSACILTAVLLEYPGARGVGVDVSEDALAYARRNVALNGLDGRVRLLRGSWLEPLAPHDTFDVVVANPPYVTTDEMAALQATVKDFEPHLALHGGPDGLEHYRALAPHVPRHLRDRNALFLVEIGARQEKEVTGIMSASGTMRLVTSHVDHMNLPRCLVFAKTS